MSAVQLGDKIAIHYRLHGAAGEELARSVEGEPQLMQVGSEDVFPGLSVGVVGMQLEEIKTLHFTPEQAYGPATAGIVRSIDKSLVPPEVVVGSRLNLRCGALCATLWVIAEESESSWRVTTKHPYAGMEIAMTVKVMEHSR